MDNDYNDPHEGLDRSGETVPKGVATSSSVNDRAMSSSAAINDNKLNTERQLHRHDARYAGFTTRLLVLVAETAINSGESDWSAEVRGKQKFDRNSVEKQGK